MRADSRSDDFDNITDYPLRIETECGIPVRVVIDYYSIGGDHVYEQPWKWTSADERKIIDAVRAVGGAEIIPGEVGCV